MGGMIVGAKKRKLPKEEIIIFARQLSLVLDSDISMYEGLKMMKEKSDHLLLITIIEAMLEDIGQGHSLTHAIKPYSDAFTPFVVNMIEIGESSGDITQILEQVADAYEKELETSAKVKAAVTYPIILSVLMFGVILLLVTQVLPMFNEILSSLGGEMPKLTRFIMSVSLFIGKNLLYIGFAILVIVLLLYFYSKSEEGTYFFDRMKFKVPIQKDIVSALTAVRFSRNLAVLIRSGISLSIGMEMLKPVMTNRYVTQKLDQATKALNEGESPDKVIEELKLFPWVLNKLFAVAQTTGHMDKMLDKAADVMEKETQARLDRLTTVIEPILIIALSMIIGIILISVILPIVSIMNSIG